MTKETDRIPENIACIDTLNTGASLISTQGRHCEVWRSIGMIVEEGERLFIDIVIKRHLQPCTFVEVQLLKRDYDELRAKLDTMIPIALFVTTEVDGVDNVVVIAESVTPWFDVANPANEEETISLLRQLPRARTQLQRFVEVARVWCEKEDKVVDLYGLDNLVLDVNREVRYIDSFNVFFYTDVLHLVDEVDEDLRNRIEISQQRLDFLQYVIQESRIARIPPVGF